MARDDDGDVVMMSESDEEAIRAKLREAGWDKNKILSKSKTTTKDTEKEKAATAATANEANSKDAPKRKDSTDDKKKSSGREKDKEKDKDKAKDTRERDRDRDRDRERDREGRSGRGERRRSRSARRRDKDRDRERERDRDRDRRRDRDRERDRGSRRRRASRSRSVSKSRSRSRSASARGSSRRGKTRGSGRGRERSRTEKRRSRSVSPSRSRSRSLSKSRGSSKRSRPEPSPTDTKTTDTVEKDAVKNDNENGAKQTEPAIAETNLANDNGDTKKVDAAEKDSKKDSEDRKSRKSSRHRSRSGSRSPSRSRQRRRRHRSTSRSRSTSRGRRGRGSSRSRSRSRRRRSSRRRGSRSRSRSRSHSRRQRSKSNDRSRRDANGSPQPHQFPPAEVAAPAVANPLNPSITQLMQQYPTMSLQDIIAKMQASNVTMAAAVSMKPARELYVGNLPTSVTGPQLQEFLGTIIQQVGLTVQPGNPILSTWISTDGHFAFCEMRSIEECNMALMLNQLPLLGQPLKFGRPKSFMGPPQPMPVLPPRTQTALSNLGCTPNTAWFATPAMDATSIASMTASLASAPLPTPVIAPFVPSVPVPIVLPVETSSSKLIMSNIPVVLTDDQVKELVEPFGELKSFELVKDPLTRQPTGSALFEYVNESVTDDARKGLDGLDIGGIPLAVRYATASEETGPVLRMANMVSIDELKDDEEFADLKEDVEEECKRFGKVVTLEIPRPKDGETVAGLGDIFVQFETSDEAAAALKALSGRKFGGNIVKVSYFALAKLQEKDFA